MMVGTNDIFGFIALVLRPASTNNCLPRFPEAHSSTYFQSILVQLAHYKYEKKMDVFLSRLFC